MKQLISRASLGLGALIAAGLFAFALLAALRDDPPPVYLSIGDGTQMGYGVAPTAAASAIFSQYLSAEFDEHVSWATTANGDYLTTATFIGGGQAFSQLELAELRLRAYRDEGRQVAAITLSIGGNDLVEVGRQCAAPPCGELYARLRDQMVSRLDDIYARINDAKDPATPLLVLLYYNASDCGQPGVETSPAELGVIGWNAAIRETAERHGAFVVDAYTPIRGNACRYVNNLDLNEDGNKLLAAQYQSAYESLPDDFR
jgi:lysophospholipase L1-like esterase